MTNREIFFRHLAQTSPQPLAIEIAKANGCFITDVNQKKYLDLIAGISVCNVGHNHTKVIEAIKNQTEKYTHVLVYGEMIESPQTKYAQALVQHLPQTLNSVYFTNSGAEATEGALKLAKRSTGRTQIISFKNSYHGSTHGALSVLGDEYWRNAYRPLLPDVLHLNYKNFDDLKFINNTTACVIVESVQAEAGMNIPDTDWFQQLKNKCIETGALLILDEIQSGFGRTGKLWALEHFNIVPDILLLGKALGGGMPMGAFIADTALMNHFTNNPVLGHITTFGGHPVCCAAGNAAFEVLTNEISLNDVFEKERLFKNLLQHSAIKTIRSFGLWMAVEFESADKCKQTIDKCIEQGLLTDWFLFAPNCMRIAPPLIISNEEIEMACNILLRCMD